MTDLWKGGGLNAFLGRITSEVDPVLGLSELTLMGADRNRGAHILHWLFSVLVGPYDPDRRLFGCRNSPHYQDPGGFLWGTAYHQRHVPG